MAKAVLGKLLSGESCFGGNLSGGNIISLKTVVLLSNSQPSPKQGVDFTFPQKQQEQEQQEEPSPYFSQRFFS